MRALLPWLFAARTQPNTTVSPEESTSSHLGEVKNGLRPLDEGAAGFQHLTRLPSVSGPETSMRSPASRIIPVRGFQAAVLGLQGLDQAVDAAVADFGGEAGTIVRHEADVGDDHVIHLPAVAVLLEAVIQLDRLAGARLVDLRAHRDIGLAGFHLEWPVIDRFVLVGGEGIRIGAHQQVAELLGQRLLLFRRGLPPVPAHCQGGHAGKVEVRQDLLLDKFDGPLGIAGLDVLVLADDIENLVGDGFHQRIGRKLLGLGLHTGRQKEAGAGQQKSE